MCGSLGGALVDRGGVAINTLNDLNELAVASPSFLSQLKENPTSGSMYCCFGSSS